MTEPDKSNFIFVLDRDDWSYKGVLFADFDISEVEKNSPSPMSVPPNFTAGFMMIIWTDENGKWHAKMRIKFPSGSKISGEREFGKDSNETKILSQIYKDTALINKRWYKNPDGSIRGMLKIIEKSNMVESKQVFNVDKQL